MTLKLGLRWSLMAGVAVLGGALAIGFAQADTLNDALLKAYRTNPELQADRARQRATDELVPAAKSGWRPTIIGQGKVANTWTNTAKTEVDSNESANLNIQLSQPIFRGFKTVEGIKSAKATVKAGREQLLAVEQSVLLKAVSAYIAVIRDQKVLALSNQNVNNLAKQVRAAKARFEAGEITTTDVSQSRARLASAQANVASAKANLKSSQAAYEAVVGKKPGKLAPARRAKIPSSLDSALASAQDINPNILAAQWLHEGSLHDVQVAKGDLLPEISLQAIGNITAHPQEGLRHSESATIQGVVTVPIYQGGREYAAVRQAKQTASQKQINIITATRSVRQQVSQSWNGYIASQESITAAKAQVAASAKALDGLNQEYLVGSRSTIDVLNAEQEVLSAKIALVTAEQNEILASYQVLASIGKLTARNLGLPGPYYSAEAHYDSVKNKWFGLDAETVE